MKKSSNKQKNTIIIILILLVIGLICMIIGISRKNKENWITDNEHLYSKAIEYIEKEQKEKGYDKHQQDYQVFTDYKGFGIEEKDNKKYVYMWILKETYYVKEGELKISEGSSMPYKIIFDNNEVIKYENPKDGAYYASSIKEMFPDSIENKIIAYSMGNSKIKEKVKEHYSYLEL